VSVARIDLRGVGTTLNDSLASGAGRRGRAATFAIQDVTLRAFERYHVFDKASGLRLRSHHGGTR
jgi:hypothetical protein